MGPALTPIARQSLSDAVFAQLRARIMNGEMQPGTTLPAERALSEMLGVNRGSVREALKRLEQARLVSIQHGGATRVLDYRATAGMDLLAELLLTPTGGLDLEVARSILEMRAVLAPDIARLCALRGGPECAAKLDAVVLEMKAAEGDLAALQGLALEFWNLLVEGSRNVAYRLAYNSLRETYTKLQDLLTQVLADEHRDLAGFRTLSDAVRRGDTAKAERRAAELVRGGTERMLEIIDKVARLEDM